MPRQARVVYEFIAGNLALDFANTVHTAGLPDPLDELKTVDDLLRWASRAKLLSAGESARLSRQFHSDPAQARRVLTRAVRLRNVIYDLFFSRAESGRVDRKALAQFNGWLRDAMSHIQIAHRAHNPPQRQTKGKLALGWEPQSNSLDRMFWDITRSAADLLLDDVKKVRQCGDQYCSWLFVDTSRNGSRRWCSMQLCGNRARVRSFRRRQTA